MARRIMPRDAAVYGEDSYIPISDALNDYLVNEKATKLCEDLLNFRPYLPDDISRRVAEFHHMLVYVEAVAKDDYNATNGTDI